MIRVLLNSTRFWRFVLTFYCLIILLYLLFYQTSSNKRNSRLLIKDEIFDVAEMKLRQTLIDTYPVTLNGKFKAAEQSETDTQNVFLHQSEFPLSGSLRNPQPRFSFGNISSHAKVVIGITTVKREGKSYLAETVDSLFKQLRSREDDVKIVVYIGDNDVGFVKQQAEMMLSNFTKEVEERNLQIISPPAHYYPSWSETIKSSFGDDFDRVKWRSKQNLDQIFLMMFVYNLSPEYYLMMEDDVVASKGYMGRIMKYVGRLKRDWLYVSYSTLGAIGKLFKRHSLPQYATFLHLFWNKKPLDWLQVDFARSAVCSWYESADRCNNLIIKWTPSYVPSLFQHIGNVSSLKGKLQLLRDKAFIG